MRGRKFIVAPLLLVFVLGFLIQGCKTKGGEKTSFYCPMHPTYVSDRPGDCPICGMKLVPMQKATPTPTPSQKAERKILYYRNPMDPTVTSPVPMKDAMGMDYVPVYEGELPRSGSPEGHAPVLLEPLGIARSGIRTAKAELGQLGETIRAFGTVLPKEPWVTHVHTKVSGWVEKLYVNFTGQSVRQGQDLLSIYSPELLASQEEFLRAQQLQEQLAAGSPEAQESANQLVQAARERLLLLDVPEAFIRDLELSKRPARTVTLTAPTDGYVLSKSVFPGQRIEPGMELYTVVDLSQVWVEADFFEQEGSLLQVGMQARVTLPYQPAMVFQGPISFIYPTVNPTTRTIRARVELPNPQTQLLPDMFVNLEVEVFPQKGVVIPDSAVVDTGARKLVFVEEKAGFFVPREVTVAISSQGKALVVEGLKGGEYVVAEGTFLLDSESRLRAALVGSQGESHAQAHH